MEPRMLERVDVRRWLTRMSPDEIDEALHFVELLERGEIMSRAEVAEWRWKLMACWAETQRKRAARSRGAQERRLTAPVRLLSLIR